MSVVYLDNAATTRALPEVADVMDYALRESYYNPSAPYAAAVAVGNAMEDVRRKIADVLMAEKKEIVFLSGGTEANNFAIRGALTAMRPGRKHIITTQVEHPSVLKVFEQLKQRGFDVTYLSVDGEGRVSEAGLLNALRPETVLVSIMHVNNETGAVNDIASLSRALKHAIPQAIFHADGVQAFMKLPAPLITQDVDLYSVSAHKIHGPKGIGALYIKNGTRILPIIQGGGQERDMRSGTENTPGILGFGAALDYISANWTEMHQALVENRDALLSALHQRIPGLHINGSDALHSAPHILNISIPDVRAQVLVQACEQQGLMMGMGSACSAHKGGKSHVLQAMRVGEQRLMSAVRLSLSFMTTREEVEQAAEIIANAAGELNIFQRR